VVVKPILPKGIKSTFDQEVLVQALDKNGKTVNVTLDPQTVHVKIPITIQSKQVSINLKQKGTSSGNSFTFDSDVKKIKVFGTQSQINAISDSVDVPIDVSDVNGSTKKSINLTDALGSKVAFTDPNTIDVTINQSSSSSTSPTNSSSSTSNVDSSTNNSSNSSNSSNTNSSSDSSTDDNKDSE